MWSTNYHKLFILKMSENLVFQSALPSYTWQIPYVCFSQMQNMCESFPIQIENFPFYPYFPVCSLGNQIQNSEEHSFGKAEDSQVVQQTSTGSKSLEILEKPKRTQAPRFRPTKNNESNICNQAFSFMTNENKSRNVLENFFKNKSKTHIFYDYSKLLSSKRKKYMSKATLYKLCTLTENSPQIQQIIKHKKLNILTLNEFQSGVRFLILYFLKHKSISSILTSQKIACNLKKDHFTKVREILYFVQEKLEFENDIASSNELCFTTKLEN